MKRIYDEDSYAENRTGQLSARQKRRLWWDLGKYVTSQILALLLVVAMVQSIQPWLVLLAVLIWAYYNVPIVMSSIKAIQSGVTSAGGIIEKQVDLDRNRTQLLLTVAHQPPIQISAGLYREILNRGEYRIYWTRQGHKIVNFESLTPGIEMSDSPLEWKYVLYLILVNIGWVLIFLAIAAMAYYGITR